MDRLLLVLSSFCFLFGFGYTMHSLGARVYRRSRLNLAFMLTGFLLQTAFLYVRGQAVGRCPLTNLFEVLIFLCWSMVLFYLLIGPAYRLSLLGAFTSPFVLVLQLIALLIPQEPPVRVSDPPSPVVEAHAALSLVAYGAFALAMVAGLMYLAQERQLKTHHIRSIFYHLPPIHDLAVANRRLIWAGFGIFTVGLFSGIAYGSAHVHVLRYVSLGSWLLYASILAAIIARKISPRRVAVLSVAAFCLMLATMWGVQFFPKQTAF
jgi:ABC-type uncharacterized transport system permease subunit